jgi:MFS transporter, ACS family, hexuronate transporter
MAHAFVGSLAGFMAARAALGFGESGIFPASIKTTAEWFPQKERALATGIFNAGTNFGAIITPFVVSWISLRLGWRWAFIFTGALGFIWLIFWLLLYRRPEEHPRLSREELAYIRSDPVPRTGPVRWLRLLSYRQTWAVMSGKFITDPIWWFYLFWAPGFLERKHGLTLAQIAVPIMVIYLIADAGSVAGGWLSSWLIRRGWSVNLSRKITMLICAACVVPVVEASEARGLWTAVLLIGVAAAAHQGFSANMYTLATDMFPQHAVASVVGLAGMAGAVGGMLIAEVVGYILQSTGSYVLPFVIAGAAYLVAVAVIQLLAPRLEPARLGIAGSGGRDVADVV